MRSALLALPLLALLAACDGGAGRTAARSAVLVTLDTTNPNALDMYGSDRSVTPHLARLAEECVVYDNARSVAPLTAPAHASMLTGLYPPRHRVRDNGYLPLPASAVTLAERAGAAGYRSGAFISAAVMRTTCGLHQGFDVYDEPSDSSLIGTIGERAAPEVTRAAIEWLDERESERPFFLWVHYYDPHKPHQAPAEYLEAQGGRPYLSEVAYMDAHVGKLLDRLREEPDYESMALVVVGDHGESLGRHGEDAHGLFAYDSTLRVPLLVRHPGSAHAGERSGAVVSVVDVFPTLLDGMGLSAVGDVDGLSLLSRRVPADRGVYFEAYNGYLNYGWSSLVGWADVTSKYVHSSEPELFDLAQDKGEERNRFSESRPEVARAREHIGRLFNRAVLVRGQGEQRVAGGDELRALGYAGVAGTQDVLPHPLTETGRPTPRSGLDEHRELWTAVGLAQAGRTSDAIARLREIVRRNPRNVFAHDRLAELLLSGGRPADAVVTLLTILELGCDRPGVRRSLAIAYAASGDRERALQQVDVYEAQCPWDSVGSKLRADIELYFSGHR